MQAVLGSMSDMVAHVSRVPVLVVPCPLTSGERAAAGSGPVIVASDESPGARHAAATATTLFPGREPVRAAVEVYGGPRRTRPAWSTCLTRDGRAAPVPWRPRWPSTQRNAAPRDRRRLPGTVGQPGAPAGQRGQGGAPPRPPARHGRTRRTGAAVPDPVTAGRCRAWGGASVRPSLPRSPDLPHVSTAGSPSGIAPTASATASPDRSGRPCWSGPPGRPGPSEERRSPSARGRW